MEGVEREESLACLLADHNWSTMEYISSMKSGGRLEGYVNIMYLYSLELAYVQKTGRSGDNDTLQYCTGQVVPSRQQGRRFNSKLVLSPGMIVSQPCPWRNKDIMLVGTRDLDFCGRRIKHMK